MPRNPTGWIGINVRVEPGIKSYMVRLAEERSTVYTVYPSDVHRDMLGYALMMFQWFEDFLPPAEEVIQLAEKHGLRGKHVIPIMFVMHANGRPVTLEALDIAISQVHGTPDILERIADMPESSEITGTGEGDFLAGTSLDSEQARAIRAQGPNAEEDLS